MFDIEAIQNVVVQGLEFYMNNPAFGGGADFSDVIVYTTTGSYYGQETNQGAWTQLPLVSFSEANDVDNIASKNLSIVLKTSHVRPVCH